MAARTPMAANSRTQMTADLRPSAKRGFSQIISDHLRPRFSQIISGHLRLGQTAIEYGILIVIIVAAVLAMPVYIKRGVTGRLRSAADSVGSAYEPGNTTSTFTLDVKRDLTTKSELKKDQDVGAGVKADVIITTVTINTDASERSGNETVGKLGTDLWK